MFDGTNIIPLPIPPDSPPTLPVLIPPAYGLQAVGFETYTGDGLISYWNSYVGVSQMGGQGSFNDPRIGVFITQKPDRVTPKLPALLEYQLGPGRFLRAGALTLGGETRRAFIQRQGRMRDVSQAADLYRCLERSRSSVPFLHDPAEVGTEPLYAARSATGKYRTSPLRGIWQHPPYFMMAARQICSRSSITTTRGSG